MKAPTTAQLHQNATKQATKLSMRAPTTARLQQNAIKQLIKLSMRAPTTFWKLTMTPKQLTPGHYASPKVSPVLNPEKNSQTALSLEYVLTV